MSKKYKKVLVLGSGALKIGQAGEFDYSGSQAMKALREEKVRTVLINPNIATIQTSRELADKVYFLPITEHFVEKVIEKERPDGVLLSFGGQTALNCGINLYKAGVLKKYKVDVLGTPIEAIILTEDREKFARHLKKIHVSTPKSFAVTSLAELRVVLRKNPDFMFPFMVRAAYTLGGQKSGVAYNHKQLETLVTDALAFAPQVLVEQYLHHYKEIEYEVVRDAADNCITVCNMENMDPLGIHTGDSIVVAPSQTLTNYEYHELRKISTQIVRSLGIVGECNVQFALNPRPKGKAIEYYVIEVNARLSRSSALASKATGYPLAYVAAKLALGKNLTSIKNHITKVTESFFEPALDYIVVKIPRWDIEKFKGADERIGSGMKSVGEVMGIGRTFEEAYQKAIRMLDLDLEGTTIRRLLKNGKTVLELLAKPSPKRMFAIADALRKGISITKIHKLTGIDPWFLYRVQRIINEEMHMPRSIKYLTGEKLRTLKELGFSDKYIGELVGTTGLKIRSLRKKFKILPQVFQIDTLAGEFPARTNYLYLTYNGGHHDIAPLKKDGIVVLGGGPYRIGSSVEFDWTSVSTVNQLRRHKKKSIIINCNPETVSTDYDISDRLYFEELTFERIADICDFENSYGVVTSVGGQTPNNRASALKAYGIKILGTDPVNIDRAEDRSKFSKLLDQLEIVQPAWNKFTNLQHALSFAEKVGYPVLMRPSFVLSGTLMRICYNRSDLSTYLHNATLISKEYPITLSKFIEDAKEVEFDAVAQNGQILIGFISEHIENAGVHSGDATIVYPAQRMYVETQRQVQDIAKKLAKSLQITGPFNIQFLARDNHVSVIEINVRASRTFPFLSKATGVNLIRVAVDSFFGKAKVIKAPAPKAVVVKEAQFSFSRLTGADPILHVEMASTGEVGCFGDDLEEAFFKGALAVGDMIPEKGVFVSLRGDRNREDFLESARKLRRMGLPIYATQKTAEFFKLYSVETVPLHKIYESKSPNIIDFFGRDKIDLVINIPDSKNPKELDDNYYIRRASVDHNITLFTNLKKAELFIDALANKSLKDLKIKSWDEYIR